MLGRECGLFVVVFGLKEPMPLVDSALFLLGGLLRLELGLAVPRRAADDAAVLPHAVVQVLAAAVRFVHLFEAHRHDSFRMSLL